MAQHPPTLKHSEGGEEAVLGLQNALNNRGQQVHVDGIFGSATEDAVRRFQHDSGLEADGIVGPLTWGALCVQEVKRGDTLSEIAQRRLGDANRFHEIFDLNSTLLDSPDRIFPDQVLTLPHDAC
jgi:peptidoglycan hydrolase-like protein with peptidoglycan-binding domain